MSLKTISVVVPVYNSQGSLGPLLDRLCTVLREHAAHYENIFVNDGRHDKIWEVICRLVNANDCVRAINLMRNYGQHNVML
jgi:undecaprenyl-phosphate 4-deoxy-4-formamido-L-arabinose transferase